MKLLIASDIHGAARWCRSLMDEIEKESPERVILLGDLLYHGPRNDLPEDYAPKEVIAMLNGIKDQVIAVRGNCEAEVDQMVLEFPVMAEYAVFYIGDTMYFATHGHKFNKDNPPCLKEGDVLLHGHTHVVANEQCRTKGPKGEYTYRYINPGSVSIPKENTGHGYVILTEAGVEFRSLE